MCAKIGVKQARVTINAVLILTIIVSAILMLLKIRPVKNPISIPKSQPQKISSKFLPMVSGILLLSGWPSPSPLIPEIFDSPAPTDSKAILAQIPKTVIAAMSSKLEAAIMVVGIPFFVPYSALCKIMTEGTKTAGLTAARQNPKAILSVQGIPKRALATSAEADASPNYGPKVNRTTVKPFPANSNSRPPIIKITHKQT